MKKGPGPLVFLLSFLLYALTAAPEVGHGHDTGELTTAVACLGVAHPPGYPLYIHLGHLWMSLLPWGNLAWRLNLFSGFCVALACGWTASALSRATGQALAGWVGGLLLACATGPWRQAVTAEVFALQLAFLGLLLWMAVVWEGQDDPGRVRLVDMAGLVLGLGLAHHHIIVLAVPGLLVFGYLGKGEGRPWGFRWTVWAYFLLGSLPWYLDMMLRARLNPAINWGDPSSWSSLRDHFLRRAYGTFKLSAALGEPGSGYAHITGYLVSLVRHQLPLPLCLLSALGLAWGRRRRALVVLLGTWAITYGPFFSWLGQQMTDDFHLDLQERFYTNSILALCALAGLGAVWLKEGYPRAGQLLWLVPALSLILNLPKASQAGQYQGYDTGRAMLDCCSPGSMLVVAGDLPSGTVDYLQTVEGYRTDVVLIYPGLVGGPWFIRRLPTYLQEALQRAEPGHDAGLEALVRAHHRLGRPVYFNHPAPTLAGQWRPRGLVFEWFPVEAHPPQPAEEDRILQERLRLLLSRPLRGDRLLGNQAFWQRYMLAQWYYAYRLLARLLYRQHPREALVALEQALEVTPGRAVDYLNLGLLHYDLGQFPQAEQAYRRALEVRPEYLLALAAWVDLLKAEGRPEEAQRLRARVDALRGRPGSAPPGGSPGSPASPATEPGASSESEPGDLLPAATAPDAGQH